MLRFSTLLHQRNRRGKGRLAGPHGAFGGLFAIGLGGDVQSDRLSTRLNRFDVLDHVALTIMRCELANGEFRPAVGAGRAHEGRLR